MEVLFLDFGRKVQMLRKNHNISQENLALEHYQEIILNKKEELNTLEETEKNYANTLKEKYALEVEKEYKNL